MKQYFISICCILLAAVYPTAMVVEIIGIKIQRHEFKKAFRKSNLELSKMETVFLSHQAYKGQQPGDEFHLGGNKYDVISVRKTTEGYYIQAFNDTVEKQLEIRLAENCKSNGNHPSNPKFTLQKLNLICESLPINKTNQSFLDFEYPQKHTHEELGFVVLPFLPPKFIG
jgi:hypothetical protein